MAIISLNPRRRVYWSAQRTTPLNQRVNHKLCISNQSLMGSFAEAQNLSIRFFALSLRLDPTGRIANDWGEFRKSTVVSSVEEIGGTASDGSAGTRRHQTRCCEKGKPRSVSAKMPSPSTGYLPISYGSGFLSLAVSLRQLVFFCPKRSDTLPTQQGAKSTSGKNEKPRPEGGPGPSLCADRNGAKLPPGTNHSGRMLRASQRESRDSPMLNAFWRVAPSDRFKLLAMRPAFVFFRASVFNVLTSSEVHARFKTFLAIKYSWL